MPKYGKKSKKPEKNFWKLLKAVQAGPNTMGPISQVGDTLQSQFGEWVDSRYSTNNCGFITVEANPMAEGGFALKEVQFTGPNTQRVYWLPWLNQEATVVKRKVFENECEFFMTSALSGCRFSVTPDEVLHVANSAQLGNAPSESRRRSSFEENITGARNPFTRRLSISNTGNANDTQYGGGSCHRALVFGIREYTGQWTYKVFHSYPPPGSWSIL